MKFTMEVRMDNDAFVDDPGQELARILRRVAEKIEAGSPGGKVMDINGNSVGGFGFDEE